MTIGGVSIILILGLVNLVLIIFQLLSGFRKINVPFSLHRKTGVALFIVAVLHGALAMLANM